MGLAIIKQHPNSGASAMKDTEQALQDWGHWQRNPDLRMNVRCGIAVIMAANVGGVLGMLPVSDDEALRVDRVVATLKIRNNEAYRVLWRHYVNELSTREIAKDMRISHNRARDLLTQSVAWIDGALSQGEFIA